MIRLCSRVSLLFFCILLIYPKAIDLNEVKSNRQTLSSASMSNSSKESNVSNFSDNVVTSTLNNKHLPNILFKPEESRTQFYSSTTDRSFGPLLQFDPNSLSQFVGDVFNGMTQKFQNLLSYSRVSSTARNQVNWLNGENIMTTASRLLPTASKWLGQNTQRITRMPNTIAKESEINNRSINHEIVDDRLTSSSEIDTVKYDAERTKLRQDIITKVAHLQTILATASEVANRNRDVIMRRIVENVSTRLNQAKDRANRIQIEPLNVESARRALNTINQGINGMHSFIHGLLDRINISINVKLIDPNGSVTNTTEKEMKTNTDISVTPLPESDKTKKDQSDSV